MCYDLNCVRSNTGLLHSAHPIIGKPILLAGTVRIIERIVLTRTNNLHKLNFEIASFTLFFDNM